MDTSSAPPPPYIPSSLPSIPSFSTIRQHVFNVYFLIFEALVLALFGVLTQIHFMFPPGPVIIFTFCLEIILIIAIASMDKTNYLRSYAFLTIGYLMGMQLGDMVLMAYKLNPYILLVAFLGTVTMFGALSLTAYLVEDGRFLYMGGILSSSLSLLLVVSILSLIIGVTDFTHIIILFAGLVLFACYVLYDTSLMIEKFTQGDIDEIMHALGLFLDFANIFVRILGLLMQYEQNKNKKKS